MKNRHSCGLCDGCCRNCPRLQKKAAQDAPWMPKLQPTFTALPAMAPAAIDPPAAISPPLDQPEPADAKTVLPPAVPESGELADFLAQHPKKGLLRVQAFLGPQTLPVVGANVRISRDFDGKPYVFFEGETDMSGIVDGIVLPAAARGASQTPGQPDPSATYDMTLTRQGFETLSTTVDIYEGIKTIQPAQLRKKGGA